MKVLSAHIRAIGFGRPISMNSGDGSRLRTIRFVWLQSLRNGPGAIRYIETIVGEGANPGPVDRASAFNTATSLTGRAVADIISPGVDVRW
jgi:hypothetical protein